MNDNKFSAFSFFFTKTTFAKLVVVALLVGGFLAYKSLIKETTPDLAIGVGIVFTEWAGGDPQSIEQEVTNKIEKELKSLKGLKRLQSGSYAGFSLIAAEFHPYVEQNDAMTRLRAKVSSAEGELPRAARKPTVVEASVSDEPIFSFRLYGDADLEVIGAIGQELKKELGRTPGVNKVNVWGEREDIIQIRLLGARMAAYGISPTIIKDALAQANLDMPWGNFDGEKVGAGFRLLGRFRDIDDIGNLPIGNATGGRTILLKELAEVKRGTGKEVSRVYFAPTDGEFRQAIDVTITKRPGADAIKTIAEIKKVLAKKQQSAVWPAGVETTIVVDESVNIQADLSSIFNNGWQAMLAVFIILLISLSWREAIVAGLAIPITFAGALIVVLAMGFSLNQIVIIGMVLALGLLVDDFILMMEGMHENLYMHGKSFVDSAAATIKTYAIPSLSGSMTTILAMAPLLGIAGLEGKFIRQMPMTAIACLVASYLVSIFVAVPLASLVMSKDKMKKSKVDILTEEYSAKLTGLLRNRFVASKKTGLELDRCFIRPIYRWVYAVFHSPYRAITQRRWQNHGDNH